MIPGIHTFKNVFQSGTIPRWNIFSAVLLCFAAIALTSFKTDDSESSNLENLEDNFCNLELTIRNVGHCDIEVYEWLSTGDVLKATLASGEKFTVTTQEGAMWRVNDGDWGNLVYDENRTIMGCSDQTWNVNPIYCGCNSDLTINNNGSCPTKIYKWIPNGDIFETTIHPGGSHTVTSIEGAMWRAVNTNQVWSNLLFDEHYTVSGCSNQIWNLNPNYCDNGSYDLGDDWAFGCADGKRVDIYGRGIKNDIPSTLNIPISSNVYQVVTEIVYKSTNPGSSVQIFDDNGVAYTALREQPMGTSSNVWIYRAVLPGTSSVTYNETDEDHNVQSITAYAFRMNVQATTQKGVFTHISGYNNLQTLTFDIPTDDSARNINLAIPMSELTPDGRYLLVRATAGGVTNQHIVYGPNTDFGNCCYDILYLSLPNVPGNTSEVTLEIDTRHNQNGQTVNGQSYVLAGAVTVDVECPCTDFDPPINVGIDCTESTDPSNTGYPTFCDGEITNATFTDTETGDCPKTITRTWEFETQQSTVCTPNTLVRYDMDGCTSFSSDGSHQDYSEFTPDYPSSGSCINVDASGVYQNDGPHSCIAGQGGSTAAACFSVGGKTSFENNSEKAIRFEVTLNPSDAGRLTALKFYEWAPDHFNHLSGNTGTNNFPEKYGVRVLKGNTEIFKQTNINTTQSWSLETFDFSNNPDFEITSTTTFRFELMSYQPVGNGGDISAWDLDNIRIEGCCGSNSTSQTLTATQTITINDDTAPTVSNIPADITVECDENPNLTGVPNFNDDCDDNLVIDFSENMIPGLCDDNFTMERVWTAMDDCGNLRTATQIVTYVDTTNPNLDAAPTDIAVECDDVPAPANLTATDNCDDDVLVTFNENRINGTCDDSYTLERIWIATDNCGNTVQETQIITVADQTPPVFANLPDVTLECSDDLTPPNPIVTDNCAADVTVILNDEFRTNLSCTDNYTLTRIWTATDNCGNQSTYTQVATIEDTTAPSITAPADDTVLCDDVPAPANVGAIDNCDDDVNVTFAEVRTDGDCPFNYTLTRTWTATDNCGNVSSDSQVIEVIDGNGPEILNIPQSMTVECDEFQPAPTLDIVDDCDANATISLDEEMQLGVCDDNYTVIRTWTAVDACGNTTTAIQVVTVTDTTSPVLDGIPADITVECDAIPAPAQPTASDNCDTDVLIEFEEFSNPLSQNPCGIDNYKITRVWRAIDNCGNVDIQQQEITVEDTTNPTLGNLPADEVVECDAIPAPAQPTATDNCDDDVTIDFSETSTQTNNGECSDDSYVITRTWVATDNCGNTDTYSQTINVQDTTNPELVNIPANITINTLPAPAPATNVSGIDNCDGNVIVTFEETVGEGCLYEIVRTWTATDNCGNTDVQSQTITVELDPQAGTLDIDDSLVCLAPAGNGVVSATPNGDANVPAGFSVVYILTSGNGLVVEQTNSTPTFTALTPGDYTIHTLLYVANSNDPNFLDLSNIVPGTTTGFDVNALLQQGGGDICGSLDVAGAEVDVDACDAKIGDMTFEDLNGNGIMDAGEPGVEGVIVNLEGTTDDGEAIFASTMTDANGKYTFENLAPGDYKLTFITPIGYEPTYANEGGDDANDSDADPTTGMTVFEDLDSGEDNPTYDAGFIKLAEIGDMVFEDINGNGIMDAGEPGIEGVSVTLTGATGNGTPVTLTTTTDANGKYIFEDLLPGEYKLTFGSVNGFEPTYANEGGDDANDSDADQGNGMTDFEDLTSGESNLTYDAGYYQPAKIGDLAFIDTNANGIQDAGEQGLGGVEVTLTGTTGNGTAVTETIFTDANGMYMFGDLAPGDYKLTFDSPTGFIPTYANEGGDDTNDSDADPTTGMTVFETLESGENNPTYDAGFFEAAEIGDMVFEDLNGNGIMDAGEPGIEGVEVTLTGNTGNGTPVTLTATTDADGKYLFEDLAPGEYKLTFETPTGYEVTYNDEGADDANDSDVDPANGMTIVEVLESGETNTTYDAGFFQPARIGNFVFEDLNANGIQDAGEPGIEGIGVTLTGTTGNGTPFTMTATTDENGEYYFNDLRPGEYKLTFDAFGGFLPTYANEGADDALDSDADVVNGMTVIEVLESGEDNPTYDAGFFQSAEIGDMVFEDLNGNGIMDAGEPGIEGVAVTLTGTTGNGTPVTATATTDANGKYIFEDLAPGEYKLTFGTPTGYEVTYADEGGDDANDSDVDPLTNMTVIEVLESGETNLTYDAGYFQPARIGNFVFEDLNANGIQDVGEPGINGVEVTLTGTTGNGTDVTLTAFTDANGEYYFNDLRPGEYKLTFGTPLDFIATYANEGGDDATDSDADVTNGMTVFETLESGEDNPTYDAGFFQSATIGDMVFEDLNGNGIMDTGEPGIEGVEVTLTGNTGNGTSVTLTTTTDADGKYLFEDLAPGEYKLTFTTPNGFVTTYLDEGGNDANDSDIDPATGMTIVEVLESGEANLTYDAGYFEPARIGNFVFEDLNANGIQDAGEPGIDGIGVTLTGTTGNGTPFTMTTTTDANGEYYFNDLRPGEYKLTFDAFGGFLPTYANEGADDALDSDADPVTGMTVFEVLESGEDNPTYDAGFFQSAEIGDMVFEDLNGNGIMDAGEPGIEGVVVTLTGTTGNGTPVTATTTTDANGKYIFEDLAPGEYKLTFATPTGYEVTYADEGGDDANDSDVDPLTNMTVIEVLESGETNLTYDAGYFQPARIGNFVFEDLNANGIQDASEPGINGVEVTLTGTTGNGTDVTLTAFTDANGEYYFNDLRPGDYKLTFGTPLDFIPTYANEGGDDTQDSDADVTNGMTAVETLTSGEDNTTYDAGFFQSAKIGDFVFEDLNGNGIQDAGEPGIEGVEVTLTGTTGNGTPVTITVTTGPNGEYLFDDLAPGTYKLTFETPTGLTGTYANEGGDDANDSDVDPAMGMTDEIVVESGEENLTIDAGFFEPAKIGNFVFEDLNANGIQDAGEPGINQATVILTGTTGNGTPVNETLLTDANGAYLFDNLAPGEYKLTFEVDPLFQATFANVGGDDAIDSDVDPITGMTVFEVLTSGEENLTYDAGYYALGSIGNFVWKDCDKDGMQGTGEEGLEGVPVTLTGNDGNGNPVNLTTSSDANGNYIFENLIPGTYKLTFGFPATPVGLAYSPQDQGNNGFDSDVDANGMTADIVISSGLILTDVDAGFMDVEAPTFAGVPADVTVECDAIPTAPVIDVELTATDNCDTDVDIVFSETTTQSGNTADCQNNTFTITRTWTATDDCGNVSTTTQIITVEDTTAPVLAGIPANETVECDAVPAPATPTATDNCDVEATITFVENRIDGNCEDNYQLERIWTATDNCGNSSSETQIITVQDTTNPELIGVPGDVTVECDLVPAPATPLATDNCDVDVDITFEEIRTDGDCPDSYILTRTWTATDNCGNTDVQVQVITVQDITAPALFDVPANITVECDAVPAPSTAPFADDNCDDDVTITVADVRVDGDCLDNYTIERTWTATDNCGNATTGTQTITVQDTTDPLLAGVPADETVECDAIPAPATPTASDNCDVDVDIAFEEVRTDGACLDNYTLTRTWTATDNCGNEDVQVQVITVQDTTDPLLAGVPADAIVECNAVPAPATPTASDNCDADVDIAFEEVRTDGACLDNYTLTRTWTATDNCGNTDVQVQVITVQDTTDPILAGIPAGVTVECDAVPAPATPTASDNCDVDVDIVFEEVRTDGACEDNYTLTRTWTATDNCGNTDIQTQIIIVQDTTNPELIGVPGDVTVECDLVPIPATPEGVDNCDTDVDVTYEEVRTDGPCEDTYTLTRTWTATDNCGNTDVQSQVINVQDTTAPALFDVPAAITVECDDVPAPSTAPFADDNCDNDVTITVADVRVDGNCLDNYTIERTWTATDNCGNATSGTQIINVQDTTDPVLAGIPAAVTVECDAIPAPATPTASDNCDVDVTITFEEVRTDGACLDTYTLTRTWTATDNCGNTDVQSQIITVQDTTDPLLAGVPADVTVECDAIPALATPTATDNCDVDVTIDFDVEIIAGSCPDSYTMIRTWTATDNCGNTDVQSQTITVQDTTDPVITGVPANTTVECDAVPAPAQPTVSDNCDTDPSLSFEEVRTDGACEDNYTLTRTWAAVDACGNTTVEIQVINVQDTTNPVLAGVPADATVECDAVPAPATPTATDNCDVDVDIVFAENISNQICEDSYTITRTWTATDNCGNATVETQVITVQDTTDPVLSGVPVDVTVECDAVPAPATPTATDNCDTDVDIVFAENISNQICEDSYTITRTWTATDNCGNATVETQVITVEDTTNPVLSGVPADVVAECDNVPAIAQPTASDNCDTDVNIAFFQIISDGNCADNYTITRIWTATDNCGNETSQTQVITVQDTTDPVLAGIPADVTVECDAIPAPAQPTASDNCDTDVDVDFEEIISNQICEDSYTITRTWIATDNCGNTDVQSQFITVQDTTDPILSGVPADATVECDAIPAPAQPTATDNCDTDVSISFTENITAGNCTDNYTITRTWTATDNCGNETSQTQTLTIQDNTNPTIAGVPADVIVECDAVPAPAQPVASDNCDVDVDLNYEEVRTDGSCEDNYTLTRTWTAIDNCGNTTVEVQVITVQDTTNPVLSGVPADETVECDAVPAPAQPTASDNCDADVTITFAENISNQICEDSYTITRTWTATDNCGNADVQVQVITVVDTTIPVLLGVPGNVTAECDAIPAPAVIGVDITATDNCDTDVTITLDEIITPGSCTDNYTITRRYTATDNCGNEAVAIQIVTVEDTTAPTISGVPADLTAECDEVPAAPAAGVVTVNDNCDTDVLVTFSEIIQPGACADSYTIKRIWTATDNCGNITTQTQNITVSDVTAPVLTGVPVDAQVSCNSVPTPPTPGQVVATDNCDVNVNLVYFEELIPGACDDSYTLKRTWTATDNCGNESVGTQVITVGDAEGPTLSGVPSDVTVECNDVPAPAQPIASDDCDTDVDLVLNETVTDGSCIDSYILTRTWTATDNCGNITTETQVITVQDTQAPVLAGIPADATVDCDAVPAPATPIVNDNCDTDVELIFDESSTPSGCGFILTRTWTATDNCGNSISASQILTVNGDEPTLSSLPQSITVECNAVPAPAVVTANSPCLGNVTVNFTETITDNGCIDSYTIERTWTTDAGCGTAVSHTQTITVQDTQAPILTGVPADLTVACGNIPAPAAPTASDNCDTDVNISFTEVETGSGCNLTITRTWIATDNCGNNTQGIQVITTSDNIDPVLVGVPADESINCSGTVPTLANVTATDNCDTDVQIDFVETNIAGTCADSYTLTRTWTATDDCGNSVSATQTIEVGDSQAPSLTGVPADMTANCDALPAPAQPVASDDCDTDVDISFNETQNPLACGYELVRTWTATDNCGNTTELSQTITVEDQVNPTLVNVPASVTVQCNAIPAIDTNISATDNCDTNPLVSFNEVIAQGACIDNQTITRTWTATDACGNTVSETQIITVEDTTNPTIAGIPADVTVDCNNIPAPATPFVNDNCDTDVDIDFNEFSIADGCGFIITRTWTATDNCGNTTEGVQVLTVNGDEPTLSSLPQNVTVECNDVPAPAVVTASSPCLGNVTVNFTETITDNGCADTYTIERTWTTDAGCGTAVSHTQTITVQDTQAPILAGVPADLTVACGNIPAPAQPVASDNCDTDVDISFNEVQTGSGCNLTITRTWIATDNCGNNTEGVQVITTSDNEDPILVGVPADESINCSGTVPTPANVTATDNCDTDIQIDFVETNTPGVCADSYTLTRTWTATDDCGNTVSASQMINVGDTQAPILSGVPADMVANCDAVPAPAQPVASDDCDTDVDISFNEVQNPLACGYELVRTWTASDNCGNTTELSQTITIEDQVNPILINVPADVAVQCNAIPAIDTNISATDNCDTNPLVSFNEVIAQGACIDGQIITRTWTATDACGNTVSQSQIITVEDTQAPVLAGIPADVTVDCNSLSAPATPFVNDNCDTDVDIDFNEVSIPDGCGFIITRTWTATDNCGNTTEGVQVLTVTADEPVLSGVPADITVECNDIPAPATLTANSNCLGNVPVTFSENITNTVCGDSYTIERTWTTNAGCGTAVSHTQIITVQDTQAPILAGIPADMTAACGTIPAPAMPVASDNCDTDVDITFNEVQAGTGCNITITRTWTATDNCGNTISASQVITTSDNEDPILVGLPADESINCSGTVPTPANVTATDNCDTDVQVDFVETNTPGVCNDSYILTRTWTATDDCGNTVSASQTINVGDTQGPVLTGVPADVTVDCGAVPAPAQPVATDDCDVDVDILFNEVQNPLACGYELVRTWTASDNCGNTTELSQTITVEDTQAPTISGVPADMTVDCGTVPAPAQLVASDNCDTDVDILFDEVLNPLACGYELVRTWTASDICGNTTELSQTITVEDTQAPTISGVPANVTVDCNNVPTVATPVANDNCDTDVDLTFDEVSVADGCGFIITRTWTATDDCGNTTEGVQLITVTADTPVLSGTPADVNVDCNNIPAPATVTATSDCVSNIQVDFVETIIPGACENSFTLERTWTAGTGCGTAVSHTQTITVQDLEMPVLAGIPANMNVACGNIPAPATPVANDNCDTDVDITFNEINTPLACGYTLERTWTATDNCGNSVSATQIITVEDTDAPTIVGVPADETVTCGNVPAPATPVATDNCDTDVDLVFAETSAQNGCTTIITRTWTATDDCGNTVTETQTITTNSDAPVLSAMPADITVECDDVPAAADLSAFDGCSGNQLIIDFVENQISGACENSFTLERTWSVSNACGTTSHTQIVTVEDNTNPVMAGIPTSITVDLSAGQTIPTVPTNIAAIDNCDTDVQIDFVENQIGTGCSYTLERTWTATDNCGNTVSATQVITVIGGLTISETHIDETCGQANGSIDLTVSGTAPFTYTWNNGIGNIQDPSGLTAGTYNVTVSDASGCDATLSIEIQDAGDLQADITSMDIGCNGGNDGSINVNITSGTAPFNYDWTNGIGNIPNPTGLPAGDYTVTVTDASGCSITLTTTINATSALIVNIGATDVTCNGDNDGGASANISGGQAPYTYLWNTGATTATISNLGAGTFEVTVTDANGCTGENSVTINEPSAIALDINGTGGGCNGSLGMAMVNATGGNPGYTYLWSDGQTTETAIDLPMGTYSVTVSDINGCTAETNITLTNDMGLGVMITHTDVVCHGDTDGTATASAIGGQAPYTYLWSTGATTASISNLTAGTYEVTVTDATGCSGTETVEVMSASQILLSLSSTDVSAVGNDGTATVDAIGGTNPYQYVWSNGQTTQTATGLTAGTYSVTVVDANGCFEVGQVDVDEVIATGDVNIGNYVWFDTNRDGIQDADEFGYNGVMVKLISAGPDGLFGTTDDVIEMTETTMNSPSGQSGFYLFENVPAGQYQIEFMSSSLPNDYQFTLPNQGNDDSIDSDANSTGRTSTFTVVAGQMDDLSFDAGVHPECDNVLNGGAIMETQTICAGDTPDVLVNDILPTGGSGALEYIWLTNTTGSPFSNTNPEWTIIPGAVNETYAPGPIFENTFFIRCARRAGCTDYLGESNIVSILVNPLPQTEIIEAPVSICTGEEASFQAAFAGAGATYFWDFGGDATPQTAADRNVFNVAFSTPGTKTISLTVERFGCSVTIDYSFDVLNCLDNFEYTAFTVDPTNDTEVLLNWSTRYEVTGSNFFLQHSKNGDIFTTFEARNAVGSVQQENSYTGVHVEPFYGVNYYRIKYVAPNGHTVFSRVETVVFDNGVSNINVFPNPVKDYVYVEILTELTEDATIEVVGMTGRVHSTQVVADGFRTYRIDMSDYPAGTYLVWVRYNEWRKDVQKVVKITE